MIKTANAIKPTRGFKKGVVTNPSGRPKGKLNKNTTAYLNLKSLAVNDYQKAYNILWEALEAKESWAHQIYFKELVPKKLYQDTVIIEHPDGNMETQINGLRKGLNHFNEYTEESLLNTLKVLCSIKTNEQLTDQTQIIRESREELLDKVNKISNVIELIKQKKNK